MNKLKFLGTGSCFNTSLYNTSAYAVIKDNSIKTMILFDCGETVFARLKELNLLNDINEIFIYITHTHSDHIGSLPSLIFYLNIALNIKPTICFPTEDVKNFLKLSNVDDNLYKYKILHDNNKNLYVIKQKHSKLFNVFGYLIKIENSWIYYSGDSKEINLDVMCAFNHKLHIANSKISDKITISEFYQDVTRFYNDAHINIRDLAKLIRKEDRIKITCMHFDDEETIKLAKSYGFKIAIAN